MDVNLVLFKIDGSQKTFDLPSSTTVIGRRHDCDLCIPLKRVSRRHCQLNKNEESVKIRDLGSQNGTFLNGERIDEATVKAGDYIKIGSLTFQIQIDGVPEKTTPPAEAKPKLSEPEVSDLEMPEPTAEAEADVDIDEDFGDLLELDESDESDSFLAELEDL